MSEDIRNSLGKKRPALGDLTNRPLKKGLPVILGDSGIKSVDGFNKNENNQETNSQIAKQVCQKVENTAREKSRTIFGVDTDENSLSLLKNKQVFQSLGTSSDSYASQGNFGLFPLNIPKENKDKPNLFNEVVQDSVVEVRDDASMSSASLITSSGLLNRDCLSAGGHCPGHEGSNASEFIQSNQAHEGLVTLVCKSSEEGLSDGKLASTKFSSIGWSCLPNSHFHELARCTARSNDASASSDLLKSCSCSFCLKAAYIWSDLHYQDIKGQITALKKSQKEANVLVQKCSNDKETGIHIQGNSSRSSKLEMDLMGQWRSLFLHMDDIFQQESSQLQARFVTLKDLRETCKVDLEMINGMAPGKH